MRFLVALMCLALVSRDYFIKIRVTMTRALGHTGFLLGLISDSNFQNGGLNERATVCGIGRLVAAA